MKLHIKNMLSHRCILAVKYELENLVINYSYIDLGEVEIADGITKKQRVQLKKSLAKLELILLDDKTSKIVEDIKHVIYEMVYSKKEIPENKTNYISEKLNKDYPTLARMFSETTGITIEFYFIALKIEKAKDLLKDGEYSLTKLSYELNYSSVAHLSAQFKQITGLTITYYIQLQRKKRGKFVQS